MVGLCPSMHRGVGEGRGQGGGPGPTARVKGGIGQKDKTRVYIPTRIEKEVQAGFPRACMHQELANKLLSMK
jgi:hypothetical protein